MTTLLLSKDFLLADRRVCPASYGDRSHITEKKIYVDKNKRGAIAIIGERNCEVEDDFLQSVLTECLCIVEENSKERHIELLKKVTDHFGKMPSIFLITKSGSYDLSKQICKLYKELVASRGSGNSFAVAAYRYGVKPDKIIEMVCKFDPLTSPEFDIVYAKELK